MLVVTNRPEELLMRTNARSCSDEAVIEPFLKANWSIALLGRSSTDATEGSVSPRCVQGPLRSCKKLFNFNISYRSSVFHGIAF
jgi:hypothetical protein